MNISYVICSGGGLTLAITRHTETNTVLGCIDGTDKLGQGRGAVIRIVAAIVVRTLDELATEFSLTGTILLGAGTGCGPGQGRGGGEEVGERQTLAEDGKFGFHAVAEVAGDLLTDEVGVTLGVCDDTLTGHLATVEPNEEY